MKQSRKKTCCEILPLLDSQIHFADESLNSITPGEVEAFWRYKQKHSGWGGWGYPIVWLRSVGDLRNNTERKVEIFLLPIGDRQMVGPPFTTLSALFLYCFHLQNEKNLNAVFLRPTWPLFPQKQQIKNLSGQTQLFLSFFFFFNRIKIS